MSARGLRGIAIKSVFGRSAERRHLGCKPRPERRVEPAYAGNPHFLVADQIAEISTGAKFKAMVKSLFTSTLKLVITLMYALTLAFVLLMVGFSEGRVLDLPGAAGRQNALELIAISLSCWVVLLALPVGLAIALLKRFARLSG